MIINKNDAGYNSFLKILKFFNDKYIFINGCFDIFHIEHLRMINYAKSINPKYKLVIAINSDKSIQKMNKKHPLIFDQEYRSNFLKELCDYVIIYDGFYDYLDIIKDIEPQFIVKGEEYLNKDIPEKNLGINVIYYFSKSNMSSTNAYLNIIQKFRNATEI